MASVERRDSSPAAQAWPLKPSRGGLLGLAVSTSLLLFGLLVLFWAVRQPVGVSLLAGTATGVLLLGVAAMFMTAAIGYFRLGYRFGPDYLAVGAATGTEVVRFDEIDGIYAGQRVGQLRRVQGLTWPGYYVGLVRTRPLGTLWVYCTDRQPESLSVIVAGDRTLVLTPVDPPGFRRELIRRIEASDAIETRTNLPRKSRAMLSPRPIVVGLLTASVALIATMTLLLSDNFTALPALVPLQLDLAGRPGAQTPSGDVFLLPGLAALLVAVNLLISLALRGRDGAATVLLFGTSALVSSAAFLAALRALP
jgi:hypothetical protein